MKAKDQDASTAVEPERMKRKEYEAELEKLHVELVKLQQWVVAKGLKVCIVFEGRDTAGKGGVIKAITERVSPRVFRVKALPAPTEREKSQMYLQRYVQTQRLKERAEDGRKIWKLSPMDLDSYSRWYDYSRARDDMFAATDTDHAPWYVARTDDKRRGRLNIIRHILEHVPYEDLPREKIKFPKRQKAGDYAEPDYAYKYVEERY